MIRARGVAHAAELREKLNGLEHAVTLCDESGKPIGRFLPQSKYLKILYERAMHMFSDEELQRARNEPGRPLADILRDLQLNPDRNYQPIGRPPGIPPGTRRKTNNPEP